jgi:hypothetical protein
VVTILADHNVEGQALLIWRNISSEGWPELLSLRMILFSQVGLPEGSDDRTVWRFAQQNAMVLLTANRNRKGEDSLEQTIIEENESLSLPVITISNVDRLKDRRYRKRCVDHLLEILMHLENYRGTGRLYIP